jgi:hypothetical protein
MASIVKVAQEGLQQESLVLGAAWKRAVSKAIGSRAEISMSIQANGGGRLSFTSIYQV